MKKLAMLVAPAILAAGICGMLQADDSTPSLPAPTDSSYQSTNEYLWAIEHTAEVAKDPDIIGVQAVLEAHELMKKSNQPQVEIDFFTKAIYDAKNAAVKREARMMLFNLYREQGQADKAMDQLQQLMMEE